MFTFQYYYILVLEIPHLIDVTECYSDLAVPEPCEQLKNTCFHASMYICVF